MLAAILCCGTMNVQAQEEQEFEVTEGDFNVVKQKGKTGSVTFDYDHARMGNLRTKTIDKETVVEYRLSSRLTSLMLVTRVLPLGVGTNAMEVLSSLARWRSLMPAVRVSAR